MFLLKSHTSTPSSLTQANTVEDLGDQSIEKTFFYKRFENIRIQSNRVIDYIKKTTFNLKK